MPRIQLDAATLNLLRQLKIVTELVDEAGNVIGRFVPVSERGPEPNISEEELSRREAEGGGRPLKDILSDLEKRRP